MITDHNSRPPADWSAKGKSALESIVVSALPLPSQVKGDSGRFIRVCAAFALLALPCPAAAKVVVLFHSFNGSLFGNRFPHTFIELSGALDEGGRSIHENYGYTAVRITPAILSGNVRGTVETEQEEYVRSTNVHFRVPISDRQYRDIIAEVARWRDSPTEDYNLNHNNCVSFVAKIAQMVGLNVAVPQALIKRPKAWLNYLSRLNPQLGAKEIR